MTASPYSMAMSAATSSPETFEPSRRTTDFGPAAACRVCGGTLLNNLGRIHHPSPALVAGVPIDLGSIEFQLLQCARCSFQFKHPPIAESALLACYAQANAAQWEDSPDPRKRRFDTLKQLLEQHAPGRRVLDVGCFNGAFLQFLGKDWTRFGIEPSRGAASLASKRGVTILGSTVDDIPTNVEPFDAIVLIDVIEHIADPLPLFKALRRMLTPRGIIVIGTGDADAWTWRLQTSRYWYCSLPEHVSFYYQRTLWQIASANRMDTLAHLRTSHVRSSAYTQIRQAVVNLGYELIHRCGGFRSRPAPGWLTARDHMIHIMRAR